MGFATKRRNNPPLFIRRFLSRPPEGRAICQSLQRPNQTFQCDSIGVRNVQSHAESVLFTRLSAKALHRIAPLLCLSIKPLCACVEEPINGFDTLHRRPRLLLRGGKLGLQLSDRDFWDSRQFAQCSNRRTLPWACCIRTASRKTGIPRKFRFRPAALG